MADPMLNLSPEQIRYIIVKAREFDDKVDVVEPDPGSNAVDDGFAGITEDYLDDPTFQELTAAIDALNVDAQTDLVALAWLGRGSADTWEEARAQATAIRDRHIPSYLAGTPMLGDYLEEGLAAIDIPYRDEPD